MEKYKYFLRIFFDVMNVYFFILNLTSQSVIKG